ncbi:MAG TPA: hypothetical protein VMH39_00950 [Gemmatimonadaceae bacterium]|nr:hypothetical protein [Gemmatimonadaceae bacterium]
MEGLVQSLAAVGHAVRTTQSLSEARHAAAANPPLIAVVDRGVAVAGGSPAGPLFGIALAPGGAYVLFHSIGSADVTLPHVVQRRVLADLSLPLERNRLVALAQIVDERARATGRGPENEASDELRRR